MAISPLGAYMNNYSNFMFNGMNPAYRNNYLSNSTVSLLQSISSVNNVSGISKIGSLSDAASKSLSDLNNYIYNNVFKVSNPGESDNTKSYLTTIKSASQSMKSALGSLMGTTTQSAFKQLSPVSSDTKKLSVDSSGAKPGSFSPVSISIDQVATGQLNKGTSLSSGANAGGAAFYEFQVESDGKTWNFTVAADAGDTNQTLQDKMAQAINDRNIGVSALVERDTKNGTSTLSIQSKNTGADAKNQFSIQDIYGDAISKTGVSSVTQMAQDALYRIDDGAQKTSGSNTIDLGNGVKATFLEASDDAVTVTMQQDGTGALAAVNQLINGYNDLISAAKSSDTNKALQLNYQLASVINTYSTSLNRIGINMDAGGKMTADKDKLNAAVQNGDLQKLFYQEGYSNYGFANRMQSLVSDISANPMKYTDVSNLGFSDFNSNLYSPFQSSRYSQVYNTGLFLNMFV